MADTEDSLTELQADGLGCAVEMCKHSNAWNLKEAKVMYHEIACP